MRSGRVLIAGLSMAFRSTLTAAALTRFPTSQCLTEYGALSIPRVPTYIATCTITSTLTELDSPVLGYLTPTPRPPSQTLLAQGPENRALRLDEALVDAATLRSAEHVAQCRMPWSGELPSVPSCQDYTHRMDNHPVACGDQDSAASFHATSVICTRTVTRIERVAPTFRPGSSATGS